MYSDEIDDDLDRERDRERDRDRDHENNGLHVSPKKEKSKEKEKEREKEKDRKRDKEKRGSREREREKEKEKEKEKLANSENKEPDANDFLLRHGIKVTTITLGGISHQPGGDIICDNGTIMFGSDDTEDDDDETPDSPLFGFPDSSNLAKNLREQLAEFEKEEGNPDAVDGDVNSRDVEEKASEPIERLSSPTKLPNGDSKGTPEPVEFEVQASSTSHGEVAEPVKA